MAEELRRVEAEHEFEPGAAELFQLLLGRLGIASQRPIGLPLDSQPYWLRGDQPLANFQSRAQPPTSADVVIIGAGLTGASASYHLAQAASHGQRIVVLDQGDPAGEA